MFAAARFAFPSTQSGYRARHSAGSGSWRTRPESRASRAADKARAPALFADLERPSSPPATLQPTDSAQPRQVKALQFPSVPTIQRRRIQAGRKGWRRSVRSQNVLSDVNSASSAPSAIGFATYGGMISG